MTEDKDTILGIRTDLATLHSVPTPPKDYSAEELSLFARRIAELASLGQLRFLIETPNGSKVGGQLSSIQTAHRHSDGKRAVVLGLLVTDVYPKEG